MVAWQAIPWKQVARQVFRLHTRLYPATQQGEARTGHTRHNLLITSWYARLFAGRRVTQDHRGPPTAGIDGVTSCTPPQRRGGAGMRRLTTRATPLRRNWIP